MMVIWETEVYGATWAEIERKAEAAYETFFGYAPSRPLHYRIYPSEVTTVRNGRGGIAGFEIEYRAQVKRHDDA